MGGLFGSDQTIETSPRVGSLQLQQSSYAIPVPIVIGRTRVTPMLLWYGDFASQANSQSQGGKGGGGVTTVSYTYSCSVIFGLCEGTIQQTGAVWKDKQRYGAIIKANEPITVPGGLSVAVAQAANYDAPVVVKNRSGQTMREVAGTSASALEYSRSGATYTFNGAIAGATVYISYSYVVPSAALGASGGLWGVVGKVLEGAAVNLGMSLFRGFIGQTPWSYLSSAHASEAVGYSGIAYLARANLPLGSSPSLPNHSFEVLTGDAFGQGVVDCNPAIALPKLLTSTQYGIGFNPAKLGSLTAFSDYCVANGLFISLHLAEQRPAHEWLTPIIESLNCAAIDNAGVLDIIPWGDQTVNGFGRTFTPDLTPAYDLTDDDFLDKAQPIIVRQKPKVDAFNSVSIEFTDRLNDYNTGLVERKDQSDIELFGLRKDAVLSARWVHDADVAGRLAQIRLQRRLFIRNEYEFKLGWNYLRLLPMSIVTLTDAGLGLDKFPVRVTSITEAADGELTVVAEEMGIGMVGPSEFGTISGITRYTPDAAAVPGAVSAPHLFEPSLQATNGNREIWCAVGGAGTSWGGCGVWLSLNGSSYTRIGTVQGAARYGTLAAALATATSPDTTNTLAAQLAAGGQLLSVSQADVDSSASLLMVDGELIAYRDAALVSSGRYNLTYLKRGLLGTAAAAHASGAKFARLDSSIFKYNAASLTTGQTISLKFTSFNTSGHMEESLADVPAYNYTVAGNSNTGYAATVQNQLGYTPANTAGSNTYTGNQTFTQTTETAATPAITSGVLTLNLAQASVFKVALNANITGFNFSNPAASGASSFTLILTADGTARQVMWPASVKWGGSAPTLTSTNGKQDILSFMTTDGGTTWLGFVNGQNY